MILGVSDLFERRLSNTETSGRIFFVSVVKIDQDELAHR